MAIEGTAFGIGDHLIRQSVEKFDAYASQTFRVGLRLAGPGADGEDLCSCGLPAGGEAVPEDCRSFTRSLGTEAAAHRRCPRGLAVVVQPVVLSERDRRLLASSGFLEEGAAAEPAPGAPGRELPRLSTEQVRRLEDFLLLAADLLGTIGRTAQAPAREAFRESVWLQERGTPSLVGVSPAITALRSSLDNLANSREPLFLDTESGNGRHLIANVIHRMGPRRDGPFFTEDVALLPESRQEAELFGNGDRPGLLEEARGGTLFLAGVEHLTDGCQKRLCDYLSGGRPRRAPNATGRAPETRVIAAAAANLDEAVRKRRFRSDLLRALSALTLSLPPLRERAEDIPILVEHLLHRRAAAHGALPGAVEPEVLEVLKKYPWPGNVRELDEVLARAASYREVIRVEDLGGGILPMARPAKALQADLRHAVGDLESELIARTLVDTDWNKSKAARILGLSRLGLQKKIDRYDLDRRR
jgi:DNA-binding NtrC family response regulator